MAKIAYNNCYGGFSLSEAGIFAYAGRKGITLYPETGDYGFVTYAERPWHYQTGEIIPFDELLGIAKERVRELARAAHEAAYESATWDDRMWEKRVEAAAAAAYDPEVFAFTSATFGEDEVSWDSRRDNAKSYARKMLRAAYEAEHEETKG